MGKRNQQRRNKLQACFEREQGRCFWCGEATTSPTLDHIIPKSAGGLYEIGNVVCSCWRCNNERGDLPAEAYLHFVHGRKAGAA